MTRTVPELLEEASDGVLMSGEDSPVTRLVIAAAAELHRRLANVETFLRTPPETADVACDDRHAHRVCCLAQHHHGDHSSFLGHRWRRVEPAATPPTAEAARPGPMCEQCANTLSEQWPGGGITARLAHAEYTGWTGDPQPCQFCRTPTKAIAWPTPRTAQPLPRESLAEAAEERRVGVRFAVGWGVQRCAEALVETANHERATAIGLLNEVAMVARPGQAAGEVVVRWRIDRERWLAAVAAMHPDDRPRGAP